MRLPLRRAAFANGLDPQKRAATVLREMPRTAIDKAPQWVDVAFPFPKHVISSRDLYRDTDAFYVHQHTCTGCSFAKFNSLSLRKMRAQIH